MKSLSEWLVWLESMHVSGAAICFGLERVRVVAERMGLDQVSFPVITVAGTNGKGSTCALLTACLQAAGYRVGTYTSPHLQRYNERIALNAEPVTDDEIVQAFEAIEKVRGDTPLTFFEFGTLAALAIFTHQAVDVAVLEVGLGGRLDAVNVWDADVSIVTSIGLDHTEWLGNTREAIGAEKAAIARSGRALVCGDPVPPATIASVVQSSSAVLWQLGVNFRVLHESDSPSFQVVLQTGEQWYLPVPNLRGAIQLNNAACAVVALHVLQQYRAINALPAHFAQGLQQVKLHGRLQRVREQPPIWVDVAHNGHAAQVLADWLADSADLSDGCSATQALFSILADKDRETVVAILSASIHTWHLFELDSERATPLSELRPLIERISPKANIFTYETLELAYQGAIANCKVGERVVALGSFLVVSGVLNILSTQTIT